MLGRQVLGLSRTLNDLVESLLGRAARSCSPSARSSGAARSALATAACASPAWGDVGIDIRMAAIVAERVARPDFCPDATNRVTSPSVNDA